MVWLLRAAAEKRNKQTHLDGEVLEAQQGSGPSTGPIRRSQSRDRSQLRRWQPRQTVRSLFGSWSSQVPKESDPQGLSQEDRQEVTRQGLPQGHELLSHHAHSLHSRCRSQRHRLCRCSSV